MSVLTDMLEKDCDEWRQETMRLRTALRRIISLGEKNVQKYAQQIAREALNYKNPTPKEPGEGSGAGSR